MRPAFAVGATAAPPPYASFAEAIISGVDLFPEGRFVSFVRSGNSREIPYREMLNRARQLLGGLRREGLEPGDALVITVADTMDAVTAIWAAALGSFVVVPYPRLRGDAEANAAATVGFLNDVFRECWVLVDDMAGVPLRTLSGLNFGALMRGLGTETLEYHGYNPADTRFAIPTSGTTGRPRFVGLSEQAALARWWPELPSGNDATGFLTWSSYGHVMGLGHAMPNLPLKAHIDADSFVASPLSWLDALQASRATHATMTNFGMKLVVEALCSVPERRWRLDHVRKIGVGAEAISSAMCESFLTRLAPMGLREDALILGYGLSECGPVVGGGAPFKASSPGENTAPPELDRPTRGHAMRIVGDDGYLLREGNVGRIEVRGPTMTLGYLGNDAATADLFTSDRWLRTGDLGLIREGRLTVVGREKEMVVVNARKFTCQEIEAAIRDHTGLMEVYAVPLVEADISATSGAGADFAVFIVVSDAANRPIGPDAAAVRSATAKVFRFAPQAVAMIAPGEVPRTSLGKVRRLSMAEILGRPGFDRVNFLVREDAASMASDADLDIEGKIVRIWHDLLKTGGDIARDADFFELGGDSLLALRMSLLLESEFGVPVRIEKMESRLSVAELARTLSGLAATPNSEDCSVSHGAEMPGWLADRLGELVRSWPGSPAVPGGLVRRLGGARDGTPIFWCMQTAQEAVNFEEAFNKSRPLYAMRSGMFVVDYGTSAADTLIERYIAEIERICPVGPLVLGGTCQGVIIALAITRRFVSEGREVKLLVAADCGFMEICGGLPAPVPVAWFAATYSRFNPYRSFRHPEVGLQKLAPHGLLLDRIAADYARIMHPPAIKELADGVEAALGWAELQGARASNDFSLISSDQYQCGLYSPQKELEIHVSEYFDIAVRLKNTSPVNWGAFETSGLTLGNQWLSDRGEIIAISDGRLPLPRPIAPGERAYLTLKVLAPQKPGNYLVEVDLIEEGICRFADFGSAPLRIPVCVKPSSTTKASGEIRRSFRSHFLPFAYPFADKIPALTNSKRRK